MVNEPEIDEPVEYRPSEYEVFLKFTNDEDGIDFREWWQERGFKLFQAWAEKHRKESD